MPIHCGEDIIAYKMAKLCHDKGIFIQGIPSPIVPKGTARLRAIVTAAHTQKDINYCVEVIYEAGKSLGLI
jgi:glycine C-acetyltransferase